MTWTPLHQELNERNHMNKRSMAFAALVAASAMVLAGCGTGGGTEGDGEPIVVASINALSGPGTFAEASQAAEAVFDDYNAAGGLGGRPIEYIIVDDKGDPSVATAAARDVVAGQNAVALVGSASLLDCEVNGAYYEQEGIVSIQGTGVDPVCFSNPNISPTNTGPYQDALLALTFASAELDVSSICALVPTVGSQLPAYQAVFAKWTAATGDDFTLLDDTVTFGAADYTPNVVKAKEAGCDAVFFTGVAPDALGVLKAAEAQGMDDVTFIFLTSVYSVEFAKAATWVGAGLYVPAEFSPYTSPEVPGNEEWRELMESKGIPLTSFGQGGYLAAKHFIQMIESIEGEITRESVTAAFKAQTEPFVSEMTGTPWIFGDGDSHGSNTAGWPIKIEPGSDVWTTAGDDWFTAD
jgi:branched-chain amino acid transport system substrate-binding protein